MTIRRSAAQEVDALIAHLDSADAIARDGAAARLRVIGARAVPHLLDAAAQARSDRARVAALTALEALPDPQSVDPLLRLLAHQHTSTAAAAAAALRPLIAGRHETRIIGALTDLALDRRRDSRVRGAALRALADLPIDTLRPLIERLGEDAVRDPALRRAAQAYESASRAAASLPADPADARHMLARRGSSLSIVELHRFVDALRSREAEEPEPTRRREWMTARAVAHQMLAARGSRVALYDLREVLEAAEGPLPVEFLSAVAAIGDADCAAALAAALAKATSAGEPRDWWTDHLATTFRTIVTRERITRRNPALQRVDRKWPGVLAALYERKPVKGKR